MVVEGETDALVSGITDLSLEFGFVTPYTSLFVEVPVVDKISEATTESGTLSEPDAMATGTQAYEDVDTTVAATGAATGAATEAATEAATRVATVDGMPAPTPEPTKEPGFGALFAITGLAVVAYLVRRR